MLYVLISIIMFLLGFTVCSLLTASKYDESLIINFKEFQDMLDEIGISKEEFDIYELFGATYEEIFKTVIVVIENHKNAEKQKKLNKTV